MPQYEDLEAFRKAKLPDTPSEKPIDFTIISNEFINSAFENRIFDTLRSGPSMTWGILTTALMEYKHVICPRKESAVFFIPASFIKKENRAVVLAKYTAHDEEKGLGIENETKVDANGNTYVGRYGINVLKWSMIPIDIDGGMTLEEAKYRYSEWEHIGYTSFNHLKDGKTEKFRILLLLKESISNEDWQSRRNSIKNFLGDGVDTTCLSSARGFYWASCAKKRQDTAHVWHNSGKTLDLLSQCEKDPVVVHDPSVFEHVSDEEKGELLNALRNTQMPDYDAWWKMISAMISYGYTSGDLEYVSAGNPLHQGNHGGKSASDCRRYWKNVQGYNHRVGGISPGYLWNFVNNNGTINTYKKKKVNSLEDILKERFK